MPAKTHNETVRQKRIQIKHTTIKHIWNHEQKNCACRQQKETPRNCSPHKQM